MAQFPQTIILAGGSSSRMWPLREKLLLPFAGRSLFRQQMERLRALGLRRAIIVASPQNAPALRAELADWPAQGLRFAIQSEARGMGDAILSAAEQLAPGPLFLHQIHDFVEDALYEQLLFAHARHPERAFLAAAAVAEYFPGGYLQLEGERIVGIVEKPPPEKCPSDLVNIVAHIHPDAGRLCSAIRQQYAVEVAGDDHYERALAHLMSAQHFGALRYSGVWRALKYPWQVLDWMEAHLGEMAGFPRIHPEAKVAPTATVSGSVVIEAGAQLFPGAAVVGPAHIGARATIGNQSLVRASMVGADCEIGFTSEVARSYLGEGCALHACRVLDSVFAEKVNFAAGCTTANLRMDRGAVASRVKGNWVATGRAKLGAIVGANAFLSVDAMTMPGVKIGARARVGPSTNVQADVGDGDLLFVRQQQEYRKGNGDDA